MEFILLSCGFKIVGIILHVMVYVVIRPFIQAAGSYVAGKQMTWRDAIKIAGKGALDGAFLNGIGQSIAGVERILSNNKAGIKKFYVDETGSVKIDGVSSGKSGSVTKPNQVHHYATNKSKTYTPQLEEIANRYELDLDDAWNKDLLPHQGRHPNAYHEYVLDSMKQFDNIAQGDKDIFLKLFDNLKNNVKSKPDMLYKDYWK